MGVIPGGQQGRWDAIKARNDQLNRDMAAIAGAIQAANAPDPVEQFAAAVTAVHARPDPVEAFATAVSGLAKPKPRFDAMAAVREGKAMIAKIEADRAERDQRHAANRAKGWKLYQETRRKWLAGQDQAEDQRGPSPLTATAMGIDPGQIRIY